MAARSIVDWTAGAALAAMLVAVALRVFHVEVHTLTIGLIAIIPVILLPAWIIGAWALVTQRWVHAAFAGVLVIAHLALSIGTIAWRTAPADAPVGDLTIGSANLLAGNPQSVETVASFAEEGVDVVFLQEVTPRLMDELAAAEVYDKYPYRVLDPRPGFFGSAILSRVPMVGQVLWVDGWPMTEATLDHPEARIRVVNVHIEPPLSGEGVGRWKRQARELAQLVPERSLPLLLVGDFNATDQHSTIHRLKAAGLTDAHLAAGSGLGSTWPATGPLPTLMRFDRALSTEEWTPIHARLGDALASDHRPLLVTYTLGP